MRKVIAVILASLLVVTPAFADRTMYAPVRLAPVATAGTILFANGTAAAPSMSFSADPDTGVFRPADNELGFSRGGSEALRITSTAIAAQTGYVIHSRPGTNSAPAFSFSTDNDTGMYLSGTNALSLATAGTERMRITSAGEVLFSGTTQLIALDTADGSDSKELWLSGGGTPGGFARGAHLRLYGNENVGNGGAILQTGENANGALTLSARGSSGTVLFQTNGGTERMRVKTNGQVRFVPLAADPAGAEAGDVYYNSGDNKLKVYNGTSWVDLH